MLAVEALELELEMKPPPFTEAVGEGAEVLVAIPLIDPLAVR